jgi:DNA-binding response OmpR family regulator
MNILLIEDDPGIGRFVSRGLAAEGFSVEWLRRGGEAGARLKTNTFAAAILDLGLPDVDGAELCAALRRDGVETPVLMLTARDTLQERLEGFRSGADDYLCKPFAFEELLARLNAVARRGEARGRVLAIGALRLDLRSREARIGDEDLGLPRQEFEVLRCLAEGQGRAVARQDILDRAWAPSAELNENTVDVYVGYLRRRLAGHAAAPVIETVRGLGFRLVPAT